ncbi:MAG: Ig-like domain-containing protein [Ilumatobacteraceae bacterium]
MAPTSPAGPTTATSRSNARPTTTASTTRRSCNPDPVTARGAQVQVPVTANDYDPDGEAVVLVGVDEPSNGTVEIANATTVAHLPDSGFVGVDEFEYTIADGNGTEAHATVTIELLPIDAPNRAPLGTRDTAQTGPGVPVVVDVLLNDVDPERDAIRIESFTQPDFGGTVSEVDAPSGLRGLRFSPDGTAPGSVTFTYRPVDSFGAEGEPVSVSVEIAQPSDDNRPPIVRSTRCASGAVSRSRCRCWRTTATPTATRCG